jgi:hypothetical protein
MLQTRAEKLMYSSNVRLKSTINYAVKSIKELIEIQKNRISIDTSELRLLRYGNENGISEEQATIEVILARKHNRKMLAKLQRTLKQIENKSKIDI